MAFSRELGGTGVNVGGEIEFEIVERAKAQRIAKDSALVRNIIGWSWPKEGKGPGRNYVE